MELDLASKGLRVGWILCLYGMRVGCSGLLRSLGFGRPGMMTSRDLSAHSGRVLRDVTGVQLCSCSLPSSLACLLQSFSIRQPVQQQAREESGG